MPLLIAALLAAGGVQDLNDLTARVAAFVGGPVTVDPRLRLAACTQPPLVAWRSGASGTVAVSCAAPAWRIFVAARPPATAPDAPLVRRGDAVTVVAAGDGYRVTIDGIAENDAVAGARLRVRDRSGGSKLSALVQPDGSIVMPAYTYPATGR